MRMVVNKTSGARPSLALAQGRRFDQEQAKTGLPGDARMLRVWLDGQTAGTVVTRFPVALRHIDDLDFAAAAGGMHEA